MPHMWESQGNNWWDRKEPYLCILATEIELVYFFLYTFSHMKMLASFATVFLLSRDAHILRASKSSIKMLLESNDHPFNINPFKMNALFFCKSQWQGTGEVLFSLSVQFLYL